MTMPDHRAYKTIVPSWVIEGSYAENLRFLSDKKQVEGVELLFFIYDGETKALLKKEIDEIKEYGERFLFTAHLPDPLKTEHAELVEKLLPIVRHFIVHPANAEGAQNMETQAAFLSRWFDRYGMEKFLIENTNTLCFESLLALLPPDTKLCMDTGHLLLEKIEKKSPLEHWQRYKERIEEIHLHALDFQKAKIDNHLIDHRPLNAADAWYKELFPALSGYGGIINLEVFSWEEAEQSLEVLYER
jgi:sugar phosphate isomerase/epimerase